MKALLLAIALFITSKVSDTTYLGTLKAHETKTTKVAVPAGQTTIEVFNPVDETRFTCVFVETAIGTVQLTQTDVGVCRWALNTKVPVVISVNATNLAATGIEYHIVRTTL